MMRWILIGSLVKRVAQVLVTCLLVLMLADGLVQMVEFGHNWPERLSQFVEELLNQRYEFSSRRMIELEVSDGCFSR
jgi:hypothetical protein